MKAGRRPILKPRPFVRTQAFEIFVRCEEGRIVAFIVVDILKKKTLTFVCKPSILAAFRKVEAYVDPICLALLKKTNPF